MPHFFINKKNIINDYIQISDSKTVSHLVQSLRLAGGESVKFIDENEILYFCKVDSVSKKEICAKILKIEKSQRKLDFSLCAVICVLKPDAMELAIQNAVQVGAKKIFTVYSKNCAVKKKSILNKSEKWQKYAYEAFKQCERADIPFVHDVMNFDEIFAKFKKENILIFAEKYDELSLKTAFCSIDKNSDILAVFGPEGGFSEDEFEYFKMQNLKLVTLGKLIYKAPNAVTAGLFGITQYV